jgi:glycosyltransferase involved in cell wall biosynthesis
MKVGFAARWSPLDKKSWSGISYYTYQEIKKNNEVEIFHYKWPWYLREWLTMQKSLNRKLFKKQTSVEFLKAYAKYFSKQLEKDLKKRPVDVLFVSASSQLVAYLKTDIPVIYMTDATFQQLQGYYPYFSNLSTYNIRQGIELDKKAFQKVAHCMLASDWNKNSAINDYGINAEKISVAPCGANIDIVPAPEDLQPYTTGPFRLLFLGVEWDRKGGDIALETFRLLQRKGMNVLLHIIGCVPPYDLSQERDITIIPFLDKNKVEDFQQLHKIFLETTILFLPTRAECAGVVFSEASAYGIPSVTTDTGGVITYIKNDINGYTLAVEAGPEEYANLLGKILNDRNLLNRLKGSSRKYYEEHLSWQEWGSKFQLLAENCLQHKVSGK